MTFEEKKLEDDFIEFWDTHKDKLGLGNYSDEITRFWLEKRREALKEQRKEIDENWKYKIQQVIKKISGSEYEEKQVWRDFIKLIQEI